MLLHIKRPFCRSSLLYFSKDAYYNTQLTDHLAEQGFRVRAVQSAQEASSLLLHSMDTEAVVIREEHIDTGSVMACSFKSLCPRVPIIVLSALLPVGHELPAGIDALVCGNFQSPTSAADIAQVIGLLIEQNEKQGSLAKQSPDAYN